MTTQPIRPVSEIPDDEANLMCAQPGTLSLRDYCRSLDACAELRAALTCREKQPFIRALYILTTSVEQPTWKDWLEMVDAQPRQIVDAFLIAKGLALP